ncbi:YheV family putative metal-binding protein [Psychrobacter ciconiae]|uniref:YheV family putative metal-binding protein n=1 Tax=Psychrobacter ciconiae TaxID=1553449 RepID=UPI001919C5CD|nr:YheV family putative metal-binding protein [Psychrobacter ciconiae]
MRYQSKTPKRQFLAGVRCPKCQTLDAVVQVQLFEPDPDEFIECTNCGHRERRPTPDSNTLQSLTDHLGTQGVVKFKP